MRRERIGWDAGERSTDGDQVLPSLSLSLQTHSLSRQRVRQAKGENSCSMSRMPQLLLLLCLCCCSTVKGREGREEEMAGDSVERERETSQRETHIRPFFRLSLPEPLRH